MLPTNALAPNGTRSSASTVLPKKIRHVLVQVSLAVMVLPWYYLSATWRYDSKVSCQKGPTRHAYEWQIGPFWQDTLELWIQNDQWKLLFSHGTSSVKVPTLSWRMLVPYGFPSIIISTQLHECYIRVYWQTTATTWHLVTIQGNTYANYDMSKFLLSTSH